VCGDQAVLDAVGQPDVGSPPRVRGPDSVRVLDGSPLRITPACAGTRLVDLRFCCEVPLFSLSRSALTGSLVRRGLKVVWSADGVRCSLGGCEQGSGGSAATVQRRACARLELSTSLGTCESASGKRRGSACAATARTRGVGAWAKRKEEPGASVMSREAHRKRLSEECVCPRRDSNPRYRLERAASWAARRRGPLARLGTARCHRGPQQHMGCPGRSPKRFPAPDRAGQAGNGADVSPSPARGGGRRRCRSGGQPRERRSSRPPRPPPPPSRTCAASAP
jgi:hypothetical protein